MRAALGRYLYVAAGTVLHAVVVLELLNFFTKAYSFLVVVLFV